MKFKIEETTFDYLNKTGIRAFLSVIVESNIIEDPILPNDYQKWVIVRLGNAEWQVYCKDITGKVVHQREPTVKSPIDENIVEITLVIEDSLLIAIKQVVFDKSLSQFEEAMHTYDLNTIIDQQQANAT
jgi:hypothetical protein